MMGVTLFQEKTIHWKPNLIYKKTKCRIFTKYKCMQLSQYTLKLDASEHP